MKTILFINKYIYSSNGTSFILMLAITDITVPIYRKRFSQKNEVCPQQIKMSEHLQSMHQLDKTVQRFFFNYLHENHNSPLHFNYLSLFCFSA